MPIVEILNATTFTSLRAMASKLVPSEEMGEYFLNIIDIIIYEKIVGVVSVSSREDSPRPSFGCNVVIKVLLLT